MKKIALVFSPDEHRITIRLLGMLLPHLVGRSMDTISKGSSEFHKQLLLYRYAKCVRRNALGDWLLLAFI